MPARAYDAVLFDLLTALLDSWTLWNAIAGDDALGRRWRAEYLRITYRTGGYQPYEDLVAQAAEAVGLPRGAAAELGERYGELRPWPGVTQALRALIRASVPLGIVTNCSERLGRIAAECVGVDVAVLVTAERAGFYKPDPLPYRLGLREIGVAAPRCLFVAGSPYDLAGTATVGLPTYWHDRSGLTPPPGTPAPLARATTLDGLPAFVLG
ncbi:HAD-IA family hydrolase [Methylobacterium nonmethylotrophicum]|uniref:Haloacid dehalogenase n=1 Tax=Methylobacterium nonmethylotrophicum TaxID=1141884 RepID=A0A4Z0NM35_9HYPH|nr:HAD-IA family hydrolase [Methylobacterium nonmethylotrophicum]TGD96612.1 haloacid dehalogenase [Methylobacterium nonmethylotrophicum]